MKTTELMALIDRIGILTADKLQVNVRITDAKTAYGNVRYLVTPIAGNGSVWVDASRVHLSEQKEVL